MSNGEATHEWRLKQLEGRMDRVETKIQNAIYLLVANLIGIIAVLGRLVLGIQ